MKKRIRESFYTTQTGKVRKVVSEIYLRDDITCGVMECEECASLRETLITEGETEQRQSLVLSAGKHLLFPDAEFLVNQLDFFTQPGAVTNVVILESELAAVRESNPRAHATLRSTFETAPNHFFVFSNDFHATTSVEPYPSETPESHRRRAFAVAVKYYAFHLEPLQSHTKLNMAVLSERAELDSVEGRVKVVKSAEMSDLGLWDAEFLDLLAVIGSDEVDDQAKEKGKRKQEFETHLSSRIVSQGRQSGRLVCGVLRVTRHNWRQAYVDATPAAIAKALKMQSQDASDAMDDNDDAQDDGKVDVDLPSMTGEYMRGGILVYGRLSMNRAVDGDVVAVELLPEDQWRAPSEFVLESNASDVANPRREGVVKGLGTDNEAEEEESGDDGAIDNQVDEEDVGAADRKAMPTGKVVSLVQRRWRRTVGIVRPSVVAKRLARGLTPEESHARVRVCVMPRDRVLPPIYVYTRRYHAHANSHLLITVDEWPADSHNPRGHIVKVLGNVGDAVADTAALLEVHGIPHGPFPRAALSCLPSPPWSFNPTRDLPGRRDFRQLRVMSVDPPGCTDIDDALHVRRVGDDEVEIGVHIADVSHFVKPGSALDKVAADRGTSVYLVDQRIDMLPGALSTNTCSLVPHAVRLAFSCVWRIRVVEGEDPEIPDSVEILSTEYTKSVISSCAAYSYEEAQCMIDHGKPRLDGKREAKASKEPVGKDETRARAVDLRTLLHVSRRLRANRMARGALTLAGVEVKFPHVKRAGQEDEEENEEEKLKEEEAVDAAERAEPELYEMRDTNGMIEEYMLLANVSVAKEIVRAYPQCAMLRRHPTPAEDDFEDLVKASKVAGVELDVTSSLSLAKSVDAAVRDDDPFFNKLLRIQAARCMTKAVYFSAATLSSHFYAHYGLAIPLYTHFTSPIRRYADLVVHRQLAAAIGYTDPMLEAEKEPQGVASYMTSAGVALTAGNINQRGVAAQHASRESTTLHTIAFFRDRTTTLEAHVLAVRSNGFVILSSQYGLETFVRLENPSDYVLDTAEQSLVRQQDDNAKERVIQVYQKVKVEVSVEKRTEFGAEKLCVKCIEPEL